MNTNSIYDPEILERMIIKGILLNDRFRKVVFDKFKPEYFFICGEIFKELKKEFTEFSRYSGLDAFLRRFTGEYQENVKTIMQAVESSDFDPIRDQTLLVKEADKYLKDRAEAYLLVDIVNKKEAGQNTQDLKKKLVEVESLALSGSIIKDLSMFDIMQMEITEPPFIIDGFLPKGLTMLCGKPKRGKSFLVYNMAAACGNGGKLFEYYDIPRIETLYLALEDTPARSKRRLSRMFDGAEAPRLAHFTYEAPRLDAGLLEYLEAWLKRHPGIKIIFIDTLEKVVPELRRSASKSLYSEDYRKIDTLKKFADAHGIAVVVVHHLNKKSDDDNDPQDLISGTAGLAGAADQYIILNRKVKKADACVYIEGRDIEAQEIALKWNPDTWWWSFLGDADEYRLRGHSQKILDILEDAGTAGLKLADIQAEFEEHEKAAVKKAVERLTAAKQIRRVRTGWYAKE
ncbi:MAG TPA: AAA family ATPase [bacterium]|nr:AAA family ATPase [bacterium]